MKLKQRVQENLLRLFVAGAISFFPIHNWVIDHTTWKDKHGTYHNMSDGFLTRTCVLIGREQNGVQRTGWIGEDIIYCDYNFDNKVDVVIKIPFRDRIKAKFYGVEEYTHRKEKEYETNPELFDQADKEFREQMERFTLEFPLLNYESK